MKLEEAMKFDKFRRKSYSNPSYYMYKNSSIIFDCAKGKASFSIEDITSNDWEEYKEYKEPMNFIQAVEEMKQGKILKNDCSTRMFKFGRDMLVTSSNFNGWFPQPLRIWMTTAKWTEV